MPESKPPDITKAAGLCPHGNFPGACPACKQATKRDQASHPEILANTFNEARARRKEISPQVVLGLLNRDLIGVDGEQVLFLKNYLDQVMPDDAERHARKAPKILGQMHSEAARMITDNLRVAGVNLTEQDKKYFTQQKRAYIKRLKQDSDKWAEMVSQVADSKRIPDNFASTADYRGFHINTEQRAIDISEFAGKKIAGVRPNIRIQRELANQYIHWETDNVNAAKLRKQEVKLNKRIYLTPKTAESIRIFTKLMQSFNAAGFFVQGKVLDRSYELAGQMLRSKETPIRADSIVLLVNEGEADRVLESILKMYRDEPEVFAGQPTPRIPTRIADGIAVGDEPMIEGQSLTGHRASIIEEAIAATSKRLNLKPWEKVPKGKEKIATDTFHAVFAEVAKRNNVDPDNLAFNLR